MKQSHKNIANHFREDLNEKQHNFLLKLYKLSDELEKGN